VRFDNSKLLKNSNGAFSIDQESVDLNAYLYAEKEFLAKMATVLNLTEDALRLNTEAALLKKKIQKQFYDTKSGWFYDTSIDGQKFINVMGCEGWIPLWANIATREQANAVKMNMLNPDLFNTKVPLPTLNAKHSKFKPNGGYWRGPVWLDQAYFGIQGLKQYGYDIEADQLAYKLIHNAEGVLTPGKSIRENYDPITGKGIEAENFSWSAAHYLLLLMNK
jgi:putative isomerase